MVLMAGCVDVRDFADTWQGTVLDEPAILAGFQPGTRIDPLQVDSVTLSQISAIMTSSDGRFERAVLQPITRTSSDALSSLTFDGAPLRSYLLFATVSSDPQPGPATVLLSLFAEDRIELRIIRGNELYGVFSLRRAQ